MECCRTQRTLSEDHDLEHQVLSPCKTRTDGWYNETSRAFVLLCREHFGRQRLPQISFQSFARVVQKIMHGMLFDIDDSAQLSRRADSFQQRVIHLAHFLDQPLTNGKRVLLSVLP